MSVKSEKKKRNIITLDTKLDIIKRFENGQTRQASAGHQASTGLRYD
jgi:hypothetical protein